MKTNATVKTIIAAALIPALIPFNAYAIGSEATSNIAAKKSSTSNNENDSLRHKAWTSVKDEIKSAKLSAGLSLPTLNIVSGLDLDAGVDFKSRPSTSGGEKYSGIDVWEMKLQGNSQQPLGVELPGNINVGLLARRELTYIQQFNTQKESLLRVPYDPITKLPRNADIFFKDVTNRLTGKTEKALKPGDFISYRAPMAFSLGRGFSEIAASHFGVSAGVIYVMSGQFDVQIFVMDNNHIRVKLLAAKNETKGVNAGIRLVGFSGLADKIIDRVIDTRLLELYAYKFKSDLFAADYIFNLNSDDSRKLYNKVIGPNLNLLSLDGIIEQVKSPLVSDKKTSQNLLGNLDELNELAELDKNLNPEDRRIIKLVNAHSKTKGTTSGARVSLFRLFKLETSQTKAKSKIKITAFDEANTKEYQLDGYNTYNSYQILPDFNVAEGTHYKNHGILSAINLNTKEREFVGIQSLDVREDSKFKENERNNLLMRMQETLPLEIYNTIALERVNWNGLAKKASVTQDINFNAHLFTVLSNINAETIRARLQEILETHQASKSGLYLNSRPLSAVKVPMRGTDLMGYKGTEYIYDFDQPVIKAKNARKYVEAYEKELAIIPEKLALALSKGDVNARYAAFNDLYSEVPLFAEVSTLLLLKIIPENELPNVITASFIMSAKNQEAVISYYPTEAHYNSKSLLKDFLKQNSHIHDNRFNLKKYIKTDGQIRTVDEILKERE